MIKKMEYSEGFIQLQPGNRGITIAVMSPVNSSEVKELAGYYTPLGGWKKGHGDKSPYAHEGTKFSLEELRPHYVWGRIQAGTEGFKELWEKLDENNKLSGEILTLGFK